MHQGGFPACWSQELGMPCQLPSVCRWLEEPWGFQSGAITLATAHLHMGKLFSE